MTVAGPLHTTSQEATTHSFPGGWGRGYCCVDGSPMVGEGAAVRRRRRSAPPVQQLSAFAGFRFPPEVIVLAVRWYLRFGLSYRDLEDLLAERSIDVDHVTLFRWVQRFTPLLIDAVRPCRHAVGVRWFVDETYVKVAGIWRYVYRAIDQHGQVIDVLVSKRRDIAAARSFFAKTLLAHGQPDEVVTDRAAALAHVIAELLPDARHNTRPVREQPDRVRPRSTESAAQTDARVEDRPHRQRRHPRPRVHPKPPTRPLRTRRRSTTRTAPHRRRIRRAGLDNLISGRTRGFSARRDQPTQRRPLGSGSGGGCRRGEHGHGEDDEYAGE
jgi:transposase-like protein